MEWVRNLTAPTVGAAIVGLTVAYVIWTISSNVLSSPIPGSVPGPLLAKLTKKWILFVDLSGLRGQTIHKLHKKYGPVVQVAPDEVSFASIESVKAIYGPGTTCIKSPAYEDFGRPGVFQMRDPEDHRQRQKRIAHIFAASSLQQMEPLVQSVIGELRDALAKRLRKPVDALHWLRMTALDISGEVLLGKSFDALKGEGEAPAYVEHLDNAYLVFNLYGLAPYLCKALAFLPFKGLQDFLGAGLYVYKYGDDAMDEYLNRYGRVSSRRTLLTKLLAGDPSTETEPLPDSEISVEVSNLLFAATDTTGNTLAYAFYRLCCHLEWQEKLREELRTSKVKEKGFAYQSLQTLPVLNAIVYETLRLHPAAPSALPRITSKGVEIGGIKLPGNTLLSMQALTTQRDPAYFPEPDSFKPERWISNGAIFSGTPEMREMMLVWGKGTRVCLGQYMAMMEIKILIATLLERFQVRLEGEKTHADMEMTDHFTLIPKGKRCGLIFDEAD